MRTINPDYLRRVAQAPDIASLKQRAYDRLALKPSNTVVDVGCGPAIDTIALAKLVGPTGAVLGIDADPDMVTEANRTAMLAGVGYFTRHQRADATRLPFNSESADACLCERVLQHLPWERGLAAVREMLRILRPGGRLVLIDTDWATLSIGIEDPLLERKIVAQHAYGFDNPFAGRLLPAMLRNADVPLGTVTAEPTAIRLPYESIAFLLGNTLRRGFQLGTVAWNDAQRFVHSVAAAQTYRVLSAHLTLNMVTVTKEV